MTSGRTVRGRLAALVTSMVALAASCGGTPSTPEAEGGDSGSVRFTDVAADVGLDFRHGAFRWSVTADPAAMMGGGVCWLDYDADGWLDLFVVNTWSEGEWHRWQDQNGLPTTRLYRNDGGRFYDVTDSTGTGVEVRGSGCVAADLDRDGFTDLYLTTERANVLLWNAEGEGFDVDDGSAGADSYGWHTGAAIGDVDGDGWPDLFVAGYTDLNRPNPQATRGFPNTFDPEPDLLLLNQGAAPGQRPRFIDVAPAVGIEASSTDYGLGAVLSDVDRDGDLDVYVANDTQPNRLYTNVPASESPGFRLVDEASRAGIDDDGAGMGLAAADYDTDGRPDLVVTNMASQGHDLFTSAGRGRAAFTSDLDGLGLSEIGQDYTGWGTVWADLDLDGRLDLVLAHGAIPVSDLVDDRQPVEVFLQQPADDDGPRFVKAETAFAGGREATYLARGLAAADYDNDGDVDLAVATIGGDLALLRNEGVNRKWLTVVARPSTPGTTIIVSTGDGRTQQREILAGSSYLSSEDPRAHFGLGQTSRPVTVEVRWPNGDVNVTTATELNQLLVVQQD